MNRRRVVARGKRTAAKAKTEVAALDYSSIGTTIEPVPVFRYDREAEREMERVLEHALPDFRRIRSEIFKSIER